MIATALQMMLLGFRMRILDPVWLWIAPLGLLAGAFAAWRSWQRAARARALLPADRVDRVLPGTSPAQGVLRGNVLGVALLLLFVAASGPQCGERTEIVKRSGVDLVIALDASTSMLARDVKPSRIERARAEISALLDSLRGDRVGIVAFAGEAFVQCPLTIDYSAAKLFLRAVDPAAMPQQGTAIAAALDESKRLLEGGSRGGAAKAVLLVSDGEDQEGAALDAAKALGDAGIRIYAVAVGTGAGEPIPIADAKGVMTGYKKDSQGRTVLSRADASMLQEIANTASGKLLESKGSDLGILQLVSEVEKLQKGEIESRLSVQYADRAAAVAWPAFFLLCAAAALGEGALRLPRRRVTS
jgi:Ca-activated chloride channel family protein